jgi:hypothetical protein
MKLRYLVFAFFLASIPLFASAHTVGVFWNASDGPYTVDIGYDPPSFVAGEYTRFDFLLWKGPADTGEPMPYAQIWVRIIAEDGKNTLLATGIWKQPIGPTTLLYEFQKAGDYKLEASYRDEEGNDIAVASFPIKVGAESAQLPLPLLSGALFLLGVCCGAGALYLARRYVRPRYV